MVTWFKVSSNSNGWSKYDSVEDIFEMKKKYPFMRISKIVKVTEEELNSSVIDELNNC